MMSKALTYNVINDAFDNDIKKWYKLGISIIFNPKLDFLNKDKFKSFLEVINDMIKG